MKTENLNSEQWRLVITSPNSGPWNMAVDEAILESVSGGLKPPTLRLYAWYPYCLSLGHAQSVIEIDRRAIERNGWELVRRPTGGRAILHADELTYSVCAPLNNSRIQGGVIESYRNISACFLLALEELGIQADSKPKNTEEKHLSKNPVCFQYPSDYEITFGGKKIIGSAQARRSGALLQHGSVPIYGDLTRILSALAFDSPIDRYNAAEKLILRAATLEEIAGRRISWHQLAQSIITAFEEVFQIQFIQQPISEQEFSVAKNLLVEKYQHTDWTNRI